MKLTILKDFDKFKVGDTVEVEEIDGVPAKLFWRKRLRDGDAKVEAVEVKAAPKPKTPTSLEDEK